MRRFSRFLAYGLATVLSLALLGAVGVAGLYLYLAPQLPAVDTLREVRYQEPLRVYSADEQLIAEFGESRRDPVPYDEVPERMRQAFIAAEDHRFHDHPGVDYQGLARAALYLARHREIGPGGSTITMQVARNFFLSREQTYLRKLNEILLALRIERELTKEQILELYVNKIFLGQRSYGVGAASRIYYGRSPEELTLAETAMIAGLPKAPSSANPVANPEQALQRRAYVLRRMHEEGFISDQEFADATTQPLTATIHRTRPQVHAPYVAEMARDHVFELVGEEAYTGGYRVYTTVDSDLQDQANAALRRNLIAYDRRHGYRGPEGQVDLAARDAPEAWDEVLAGLRTLGGLRPGIAVEVDEAQARVYIGDGEFVDLDLEAVQWARPWISQSAVGDTPEAVSDVVSAGDVVRLHRDDEGRVRLGQIPDAEGAVVSMSPRSGAVTALAGGFDFRKSQFNRAVQAVRQPGSAFKPFIYAAALERGYTPASVVNDAPVVFQDDALESTWRPENYTGRFYGPTRLREALAQSRNLVSIRVLRDVGTEYTVDYLERFGFSSERMPTNLSLALGSAGVTPLELTAGYAVFANGGYRVEPHVVTRIEAGDGTVLHAHRSALACPECTEVAFDTGMLNAAREADDPDQSGDELSSMVRPAERVIPAENAYLMTSLMQDVISRGTARAAQRLGRQDLAGKTGSTNELQDAWFAGYNRHLVTTSWVGFDDSRSLGRGETGSRAALPMWMDFMEGALNGIPEDSMSRPGNIVTVRIDPESGLLTSSENPAAIFETFRSDQVPERDPDDERRSRNGDADGTGDPLF